MSVKERKVAMAVLKLSDVEEGLGRATDADHLTGEDLNQRLDELKRLRGELQAEIEHLRLRGRGIEVREAAEYLGVSAPTVRTWLERGVLERIRGKKPIQIKPETLRRAHKLLGELRNRGQDRDWLQALIDYVHDTEALRSEAVVAGLEELRNGDIEPA